MRTLRLEIFLSTVDRHEDGTRQNKGLIFTQESEASPRGIERLKGMLSAYVGNAPVYVDEAGIILWEVRMEDVCELYRSFITEVTSKSPRTEDLEALTKSFPREFKKITPRP